MCVRARRHARDGYIAGSAFSFFLPRVRKRESASFAAAAAADAVAAVRPSVIRRAIERRGGESCVSPRRRRSGIAPATESNMPRRIMTRKVRGNFVPRASDRRERCAKRDAVTLDCFF